jgi:hypothetical protein
MTKIEFVLAAAGDSERTITWPCKIMEPQNDGQVEEKWLDASFTIPSPKQLVDRMGGFSPTILGQQMLLEEHLKGFPKYPGAETAEGFQAVKARMLVLPYVVDGLCNGLSDMVRGRQPKN